MDFQRKIIQCDNSCVEENISLNTLKWIKEKANLTRILNAKEFARHETQEIGSRLNIIFSNDKPSEAIRVARYADIV